MRVRIARRRRAISSWKHYRKLGCAIEPLESRRLLSTYYISPTGNDHASGQSIAAAWKSIDRVNQQNFRPGDVILFRSKASYHGSIRLTTSDTGTPTNPVTISSYGPGRATIRSGKQAGLEVSDFSGLVVHRINFRGGGMYANHTNGLYLHNAASSRIIMDGISISNVAISGYGQYNINLETWPATARFQNVRIVHASLNSTLEGGLSITGAEANVHKNVYVGYVNSFNHPGTGTDGKVTGNGIFIADVDGATVEHCLAFNNGSNGAAPVGIWTSASNRVTFQYNEAFNNKTKTSTDGGGFDFDWNVTNSTMQYNYSHDNDGPGYVIAAGTHPCDNNTIRYNISQNDARRNGRGAIELWGRVTNTKIDNNTVYVGGGASGSASVFFAHNYGAAGQNMSNLDVRDNIFYTTSGYDLVNVNSAVTSSSTNRFIGNAYYSESSPFRINWNGRNFNSLSAFRDATTQEAVNGMAVGFQGNPRLRGAGKAPTLRDTTKLSSLWQYQLQGKSILIDHGQNPHTTLSAISKDFFGTPLPRHGKYDIGADEAA